MSEIITKVRSRNIKTILSAVVCQSSGGGGGSGVDSFNGRTGAVVPQQSDYDSFFLTPAEGNAAYNPLLGFTPSRRVLNKSVTPVSLTGTTGETIMYSFLVPGGTILSGDIVEFILTFTKAGTAGNFNAYISHNTSNSLSGSTDMMRRQFVNTNIWMKTYRQMICQSTTTQLIYNNAGLNDSSDILGSVNSGTALNINLANDFWIIISGLLGNSADVAELDGVQIEIIR